MDKIEGLKGQSFCTKVKKAVEPAGENILGAVILLFLVIMVGSASASAATLTVNASGGADYTRIQDAINASNSGDTIEVQSGTYYENVNVTKQLTLLGNGRPVVDANGSGSAITLAADGITLDGFTAIGGGSYYPEAGIKVTSNNNTLSGNYANSNYWLGIRLDNSSNNTLSGNNASNNNEGIDLWSSSYNVLTNNIMKGNKYNFELTGSSDSDFDNQIDTTNLVNEKPVYYIKNSVNTVYDSSTNAGTIYCINCINVTIQDMNLSANVAGIHFWKTTRSKIQRVNASNNLAGIDLFYSSNNMLSGNNVSSNNKYGFGNNALNNGYGIVLTESSDNVIYNNYFNNINNVELMGKNINTWNITKQSGTNKIGDSFIGGNFWANPSGTGFSQTCMDGNNDGICDTPYSIDSYNFDYLPLAYNINQTLVDKYLPPGATPEERKAGLIRAMDDYFDNGALTKAELLIVLDAYFA